MYLPPDQEHSLHINDRAVKSFSVSVSTEWIKAVNEFSLRPDDWIYCRGGTLANLFVKLYQECKMADGASSIAIESIAFEMLATVSRHQADTTKPGRPQWLGKAMDLVHAHFLEDLSLTIVSKQLGVHRVDVARLFRKHYGCSIGKYIRQLRIEFACQQFRKRDSSLADIAISAGFADQSHFNRIFKRSTGMTPAKYRAEFF